MGVSFFGAMLSMRQDVGLHWSHRVLNPFTGFMTACLAGFILLESGCPQMFASGFAYLFGYAGNRIMNALLVAVKIAERDPLKFVASVIALMWQYCLPPIQKKDEPESDH